MFLPASSCVFANSIFFYFSGIPSDIDVHLIQSYLPEIRSAINLVPLYDPRLVFPSFMDPLTHPASLDCRPIWLKYPIQPSILGQWFVQSFLNCFRWVLSARHHRVCSVVSLFMLHIGHMRLAFLRVFSRILPSLIFIHHDCVILLY